MIDTHAHIDDPQYAHELEHYLQEQREGGVELILVPSTHFLSCESVRQLCLAHSNYCLPAYGIHPEEVKENFKQELLSIRHLLYSAVENGEPCVAVGEIGLDYHFDVTFKQEQQLAFREQLDWALDLNLPVMIHSRDATDDMLHILREYAPKGLRGVMHCFSGSYETAREVTAMGLMLGIGGVITFKNSKLASTLSGDGRTPIPLSHILLETDSPYMAPVPHRGERNESRYISYVIERLASVYGVMPDQIDEQTTLNARLLFRL